MSSCFLGYPWLGKWQVIALHVCMNPGCVVQDDGPGDLRDCDHLRPRQMIHVEGGTTNVGRRRKAIAIITLSKMAYIFHCLP